MTPAGRNNMKLSLIWTAIRRIEESEKRYRECEADASADADDRDAAKHQFEAAEREFAWQWKNVRELLENTK